MPKQRKPEPPPKKVPPPPEPEPEPAPRAKFVKPMGIIAPQDEKKAIAERHSQLVQEKKQYVQICCLSLHIHAGD